MSVLIQFHLVGNFALQTHSWSPKQATAEGKNSRLTEWNLKQDQVGECDPSYSS